ncbi:MAG: prolipoprotein diacylglyceryl transferase [Oscillospiraceae bacterium]|jgi:phosphatidylglycerol:prolipoprotein diacylglycerol transferase|nr:prolipoprotein diacylglyceryl transferase [Oscillospiraceae bacterium]
MATVYFKALERGFSVDATALEFRLFGHDFQVQWYGVLIAFGFLLAVLFGGRMAYKWKMNLDKMIDVLIGGTIGGVVGARLYFVVLHWDLYKDAPFDVFKVWEGGLAIYGGLIGGLLAAFIVCRVRKLDFLKLLDLAAMSFLIGQGIGRWGNFTNQEAFGVNTNLPWGMWSEKTAQYIAAHQLEFAARGIEAIPGSIGAKAYVHPTFLYESLWCLLSFVIIYLVCRHAHKFSGQLMLCYGVLYGTERFFVEGLRLDSLYLGGSNVRASQLLSALLVVGCLAALVILLLRQKKRPKLPIETLETPTELSEEEALTENAAPEEDVLEENAAVLPQEAIVPEGQE